MYDMFFIVLSRNFLLKWRWHESCRQMYAKYLYLNIALVKKCEKTANGLEKDRLKQMSTNHPYIKDVVLLLL